MPKFHLLTFIISLFLLSNAKKTPDMVVVMTRHGAREPYGALWDKSWKNSQEIIDGGVEQSYILGAVLAETYADLLKDIDMKEVTAYATYKTRTQMTVSAMLLGLFRKGIHDHTKDVSKKDFLLPYIDQDLVNNVIDGVLAKPEVIPNRMQLLHQAIVTYKANDSLTFEPTACWLIVDSVPKRKGDKANKQIYAELEETAKKVSALGYPADNLDEFVSTSDIVLSRYADNRPAVPGIPYGGEIYKDLEFAIHWWTLYNFIGPEIERSTRIYPFYRNLISWFKERVSGEINTKLILIGGHESALFPFLNLHEIVNSTCYYENYKAEKAGKSLPYPDCISPDFAAQLTWELYDVHTTAPYVKMLYNGKAFKLCPESKGVECPLSEFERMFPIWSSHLTEEEFQTQCLWPGEASSLRLRKAMPIVTGLLGVIIGLLPYCLKVEKGKKMTEYAKNIKKNGLALFKPKSNHVVMMDCKDEENSQTSTGIETNERKAEKDIVVSP